MTRPDDPILRIRLQVMWNRLISVVEQQAQTLIRTAFSTATREGGDLSAGVFDPQGRMLAQAVTGTPGHVNSMVNGVGHFLKKFPVATMREGEHYLTNDPWIASGHLHDFMIVTPCFHNGRLVALFSAIVHVVDVGGRGYIATCREVFEEGILIPMTRFIEDGRANTLLLEIISENVREPRQVIGDLYSLAACTEEGCKRLRAMLGEFNIDDLRELGDYIVSTSREAMLSEIRKVPFGTYRHRLRSDGMDFEIDIVGAVTVSAEGIHVDYTGTGPVSSYGINVVLNYTEAYTLYGVCCAIAPDLPQNAGTLEPIKVSAPEGSILNTPRPWPVAARHVLGHMLPDVVMGCLAQAKPESVMAESGMTWNPHIRGGLSAVDRANYDSTAKLEDFNVFMINSGGMGARSASDGLSATAFPSGVRTTPAEATEVIAPIVVWRKEFRPNSGGPGKWRGGLGQILEIGGLNGIPFVVSVMFDKVRNPPAGRGGGKQAAGGKVMLSSGAELEQKGVHQVPPGERIYLELPGGGGYGDPYGRDSSLVNEDVRNEFLSRERAEYDYGVIIRPDGQIDRAATKRTRAEIGELPPVERPRPIFEEARSKWPVA